MHAARLLRPGSLAQWRWGAIAVLLATVVLGVQPLARGWRLDHAHVTLGAVVSPHSHPWDDDHATPAADRSTIGFADPEGMGGGAGIAIPPPQSTLDRPRGVTFEVAAPAALIVSHRTSVPTPPPRG